LKKKKKLKQKLFTRSTKCGPGGKQGRGKRGWSEEEHRKLRGTNGSCEVGKTQKNETTKKGEKQRADGKKEGDGLGIKKGKLLIIRKMDGGENKGGTKIGSQKLNLPRRTQKSVKKKGKKKENKK